MGPNTSDLVIRDIVGQNTSDLDSRNNELTNTNKQSSLNSSIESQINDISTQSENTWINSTLISSIQTENDTLDLHDIVNLHANNSSSMMAQPLNLNLTSKGLKIGHLNIQGLQNKFDQVDLMLNDSGNEIHIFGLSETKLRDFHPDSAFNIKNYQLFRKDRFISRERREQGGGIIVYVRNGVKAERRQDLEKKEIECVWLEVYQKNSKSFLVGILYRHPNEGVQWNEHFEDLMETVLAEQKEIYLLGDFNRDLMSENTKNAWLEYIEPFGLHQKVNHPTRKTALSQTLIDHIYCNVETNISSIQVPEVGLSDHFPIFLTRKTNCTQPKLSHHTITYRSFKSFNEQMFINDLQSAPWDTIKIFEDINDTLETWSSMFLEIVDKHLPLKTLRVKYKQQPKWLTPDIIDAMKIRDRYKSLNDNMQYKFWRNKVVKLIKQSKKAQYTAIIDENNNNPNSVWKLFKEIGVNKQKSTTSIPTVRIDGKETEDHTIMANAFNKFFVSIASNLKEPTENSNFDKLKAFCDNQVSDGTVFTIPEISIQYVEKFLKHINLSKATGCDNIGPRLLKIAAPYIAQSITHICNQSIKTSHFPRKWKEAKVTPLHKGGPKDDLNNYRPISILPVISKLLEKHVHDALMAFLTKFQLLHKNQSGFRPNHSCETALIGMVCKWLESINKGSLVGAVMIDFKKAFDLVDHSLLLKKLKHYKLSNDTLLWFASYLSKRKQKVSLNNITSDDEMITDGVPQGSILGPLLFLMFINDLPLYTDSAITDFYADDTTLYVSGESLEIIERNLQTALDCLAKWCRYNGMLINTTKTKVMLITTYQKRTSLINGQLSLHLNDSELNMITHDKVLGIVIDNNLTWSQHVDKVCKKITSNLWLLSRIKDFLTTSHRIQFYKTYIQPHIDYCNTVWGGTSQINLNRILRLQKRACKIILDYNVENILESMEELKILTIYDRLYLRKAKFMHKVSKRESPPYISELFHERILHENVPMLRSSSEHSFITPRPYKEIFKQSLTYAGPIIWNSLPSGLRSLDSTDKFHSDLIKWMKNP